MLNQTGELNAARWVTIRYFSSSRNAVGLALVDEVAVAQAPLGDGVGHAVGDLLERPLALGGAERAAEVLLGDDVRGVERPVDRELDIDLLEGHRAVAVVRDAGVAPLPLHQVVGVHAFGGEAAANADRRLFGGQSHGCSPPGRNLCRRRQRLPRSALESVVGVRDWVVQDTGARRDRSNHKMLWSAEPPDPPGPQDVAGDYTTVITGLSMVEAPGCFNSQPSATAAAARSSRSEGRRVSSAGWAHPGSTHHASSPKQSSCQPTDRVTPATIRCSRRSAVAQRREPTDSSLVGNKREQPVNSRWIAGGLSAQPVGNERRPRGRGDEAALNSRARTLGTRADRLLGHGLRECPLGGRRRVVGPRSRATGAP